MTILKNNYMKPFPHSHVACQEFSNSKFFFPNYRGSLSCQYIRSLPGLIHDYSDSIAHYSSQLTHFQNCIRGSWIRKRNSSGLIHDYNAIIFHHLRWFSHYQVQNQSASIFFLSGFLTPNLKTLTLTEKVYENTEGCIPFSCF